MHLIQFATRLVMLGCLLALSACGSGSNNSKTETTTSTSSLAFSAASPVAANPGSQTFTASFGTGTLYLAVNYNGQALQKVDYTLNGNTAQITAYPLDPATVGSGIFTSTIIVTAYSCGNVGCTQLTPGNTATVVATYTIPASVQFVAPYVQTAGVSRKLILRGQGFQTFTVSDVQIGGVSTSYTVVNDTQIDTSYPASLSAGTYPVTITAPSSAGAATSQANLVLQNAPGYTATTIAYPSATAAVLRLTYDAERQSLLVARTTTAATAEIDRYPYSSGWSLGSNNSVTGLADIALTPNGAQLLTLSQTDVQYLDPTDPSVSLAPNVATPALNTGEFYNDLAVTNNNNAIVTTGYPGNAISPSYLYAVATGIFSQITATSANPIGTPSLNNSTSGVPANGSLVVLPQGYPGNAPTTLYTFNPTTMLYARPTNVLLNQNTITPAFDPNATRIILNGTNVYDASFNILGTLPSTTLAVAVSPDASRAYTFDSTASQVLSFDLTATPAGGPFPQVGSGTTLAGDPGSDPKMTISPDGGSLFIAGTTQIVVQPTPP